MIKKGETTILKISFLFHYNEATKGDYFFDELKIDGIPFSTKNSIETNIHFNKLELALGKKVCSFELIGKDLNKSKEIKLVGKFQIYFGIFNFAYCFIDVVGVNVELVFLGENNNILPNNFEIKNNNKGKINNVLLNTTKKKNRGNLILLNVDKFSIIEDKNGNKISLEKAIDSVKDFSSIEGYQFCFMMPSFEAFVYKKVEAIEELNFDEIYKKYSKDVNELYNEISNKNLIDEENVKKVGDELVNKIINRKYIYPKSYLIDIFNNDIYCDFIFKVVFIAYINDMCQKIITSDSFEILQRLEENKKLISNDKKLETFEKILIFITIYNQRIIIEDQYKIRYYHIKDSENNSPLKLSYQFLTEFINNFSEDSIFFYPLLCIDSGVYKHRFEKSKSDIKHLNSYGFDICPLDIIKEHLEDIIPKIVINVNKFDENISINKSNQNKVFDEHYGFILSKILLHETFGHIKSGLCKNYNNKLSAQCFKDKNSYEMRLVEKYFSPDQFNNLYEIKVLSEEEGESGFFLEYHFGDIYGITVLEIIDKMQFKTSMGVLLDSKLWQYKIGLINEYIKLKYFIVENKLEEEKKENKPTKNEKVSNESNEFKINREIEKMKNIITKKYKDTSKKIEDIIKDFFIEKKNDTDTNNKSIKENNENNILSGDKARKTFISNNINNIKNRIKDMKIEKKTLEKYDNNCPSFKSSIFKK